MKNKDISYKSLSGFQISDWILEIAKLRITVFREWPYLYDGNTEYEEKYLARYVNAKKSFIIIAIDNNNVVGASSCIWLPEESDQEIKKPFIDKKYNIKEVVYFGESLLLSQYRGFGIGSHFMKAREEFARDICKAKYASFCSVLRPDDHYLKPKTYVPLYDFWQKRSFTRQEDMFCNFSWQDIDEKEESHKKLQFWIKKIT